MQCTITLTIPTPRLKNMIRSLQIHTLHCRVTQDTIVITIVSLGVTPVHLAYLTKTRLPNNSAHTVSVNRAFFSTIQYTFTQPSQYEIYFTDSQPTYRKQRLLNGLNLTKQVSDSNFLSFVESLENGVGYLPPFYKQITLWVLTKI